MMQQLSQRLDDWANPGDGSDHYRRAVAAPLRRLMAMDAERRELSELVKAAPEVHALVWDAFTLRMGRAVATMLEAKVWAKDHLADAAIVGHYPDVGCVCEHCCHVYAVEIAATDFLPEYPPAPAVEAADWKLMRLGMWWHVKRERQEGKR